MAKRDLVTNPDYETVLEAVLANPDTHLREKTRETFRNYIRRFFDWADKPVSKVTYGEWTAYMDFYISDFEKRHGHKPKKGTLNVMRSAVKWLYEEGARIDAIPAERALWVNKIVLDALDEVEAEQGVKATITFDEYRVLLEATGDKFHQLLLRVLWETCRRPNEVCRIEWAHVYFDEQKIHFPLTKTGAYKWSAISKELAADLKAWKAEVTSGDATLRTKQASYMPLAPSRFIFGVGATKPYNEGNLGRWMKNVVARAGIRKHVTPHVFRGSGAVHLRSQEWNTAAIARQGGWKDVNVLIKNYFHDQVDERVKLMNRSAAVKEPERGPLTILKTRLAKGEITLAEFRDLKTAIEE